jgi:hypothetical protein
VSFAVPCLQVCVNVYVRKKGMIVAIRGRHVRCVRNYVLGDERGEKRNGWAVLQSAAARFNNHVG